MESSAVLLVLLCVSCVAAVCRAESSEDFGAISSASTEKELLEAAEDLLARLEHRHPRAEKRGSIPRCGAGDRCAMRLGPRIGTLCECPRGSKCNSFLLKCI
ncbi:hypothetical protein AAFF_G00068250 [Aldrovandia affinis]|uniref:Cocaine- and amphetamine-regulated transcript protein n=1 Tax=Aldrovandia affinis TaxID=143900 RepID=A0AAD7RZL5_9TELE|nr:hypothetical protein AAFF_G00068250 [Aldrovandia affinis]